MRVLDGGREQAVEPVGVAVLGRAEIFSLGLWCVRQSELSCLRIILTEKLVHLAIDTTVGSG